MWNICKRSLCECKHEYIARRGAGGGRAARHSGGCSRALRPPCRCEWITETESGSRGNRRARPSTSPTRVAPRETTASGPCIRPAWRASPAMTWWCPCARCALPRAGSRRARRTACADTTRRRRSASARAARAATRSSYRGSAPPASAAARPSRRRRPSPSFPPRRRARRRDAGGSSPPWRRRSLRSPWRLSWWWWWPSRTALCSARTTKRPSTTRSPCRRTILSVSPVHVAPPSPLPLRMRLSPNPSVRGCERRRATACWDLMWYTLCSNTRMDNTYLGFVGKRQQLAQAFTQVHCKSLFQENYLVSWYYYDHCLL